MGYLADEFYTLTGARLTPEQETAMEVTCMMLGASPAKLLFVLGQVIHRPDYAHVPQFDTARVEAWVDALRPKPKAKISYPMVKCEVCGRELGANWQVRHWKQAHGGHDATTG
jgi:hypothetical protein